MDVMDSGDKKIDEYLSWLEVALRAQVVCNIAFYKKIGEIDRFLRSNADRLHSGHTSADGYDRQLAKLSQLRTAVAKKYDLKGPALMWHTDDAGS